jgi:coenzyme F420-reducing hydrogenase beta subunit
MDKCPVKAISMHYDNDFNRVPLVDAELCISCGQCVKLCPNINEITREHEDDYTVYLGSYKKSCVEKRSSSGGIFAALALYVLNQNGVVYGAAIKCEDDSLSCRHIRITDPSELSQLQGSKYVQSRTDGIFQKVKDDLKKGNKVLFSGTSCQVASLKRFVGNNDNLYTVDLVCHGVPKEKLFNDYIDYYEGKHDCTVVNVSFRAKGLFYHGKEIKHVLTLTCEKKGKRYKRILVEPKSSFYCLFMTRAGYRSSCYHCLYATPNKPADITLGDYTLTTKESEKYQLPLDLTYSTIIVHNSKGNLLLSSIKDVLIISTVFAKDVIARHGNLNHPSKLSKEGEYLYVCYLTGGYDKLQKLIRIRLLKSEIRYLIDRIIK